MNDIPIFICSKDRLSFLQRQMFRFCEQGHFNLVVIDTGSTYPPMVEWLALKEVPVAYVAGESNPHNALWNASILDRFNCHNRPYIYTDCDVLPDFECPDDWMDRLTWLLNRYLQFPKIGLGLRIDDLPDHYARKQEVIQWETQFWQKPIAPDIYNAPIDTTLALYRPGTKGLSSAIRTGGKYIAKHLPWYSDSANLSAEEKYYKAHMVPGVGSWR
jgi:hypothetical protein